MGDHREQCPQECLHYVLWKYIYIDKVVALLDSQDKRIVAMLQKSLDTITMEQDAAFILQVCDNMGYFVQAWTIQYTWENLDMIFLLHIVCIKLWRYAHLKHC